MSLNAVLSNALSGLAAAQNAMTVTANNVANANTEGYSRQLPQQEAQVIGGRGTGARIAATTRAVDELLTDRLREQQGRASHSGVLDDVHGKIQDLVFGAPGDADRDIPNHISALAKEAEALAAGPDQPALAAQLVGAAQDFARELADAGAEVQNLRRDLDQGVTAAIAGINGELADLGELNAALGRNGSGPDLLDQRDRILASLAGKLEISVTRGEDGRVALYTRGGVLLLDGSPRQLVYRPAAQVGSATAFGAVRVYRADDLDPATGDPRTGASSAVLVTGGARAVLTPELAEDAAANSTQQIVSPLRGGRLQGMLEARDRLLPELADQLGELADAARFTLNAAHNAAVPYPPPSELNGTRTDTAGFAAATRGGTAFLALIDGSTGAVASTFAIDVGGAADTAGLVAQIQAGMGALGSASLNGDGTVRIAAAPGFGLALSEGDSSIVATDTPATPVACPGPAWTSSQGRPWSVGSEGQATTAAPRRSRRLREPGHDGDAGRPAGWQLPAADYAAEIVAVRAGAAERAKSAAANDQALAADLSTRRAEVTGVNLDEELSRLVLYQQAYSVSARLISITGQLFDELLAIGK